MTLMNTLEENAISEIIGKCIEVHKALGPGLFESVYEEVLSYELSKSKINFERQKVLPVFYDDIEMNVGFCIDLLVEKKVILEIKSVQTIQPVHKKQLLTYLRLSGIRLGLLINFNENLLINGVTRVANNLY